MENNIIECDDSDGIGGVGVVVLQQLLKGPEILWIGRVVKVGHLYRIKNVPLRTT